MLTETIPQAKQELFDRYWQTREYISADVRTHQRTVYAEGLIHNRAASLLDVGCGRGYTSAYFAERGFDVLGIDLSPLSVKWTAERGVATQTVDLETEPIPGEFDTILCLEVMQYLHDPAGVLKKLKNALTASGELILSMPCEYHVVRRLSILLTGRGPGGLDFTSSVLWPEEHRRLIERVNLRITDVLPISIVPPRWGVLVGPGQLLARLSPSLFALSVIYRLVK